MKKRTIVLLLILVIGISFLGYRYYAFEYRYGTEPETDLTETNTDPLLDDQTIMKNLSKYEDLSTLNLQELNQTSYVIPGLKATKTLAGNTATDFSMCTSMTPQGICITEKYLFISAYCHTHSHNSVLYMMDKNTHQFIKEIVLSGKPHAGNIAYDDVHNNIWIACTGENVITSERTAYLNCISLEKIEKYDFNSEKKPISYDKKYQIDGFSSASFLSYYRNNLFVGHYYEGEWKDSYVVRFPIDDEGGLETKTVFGNHEIAYGKEKAVIDQYCQGVYLDTGYCILIQSSGTKDSKVQSFVNSDFQEDVEAMIDLDEQYKLYLKQQEALKSLELSLEEQNHIVESLEEDIDDLKEEKAFLIDEEDKEGYQEIKEKIDTLKDEKDEAQLKALSIKKEINILQREMIDFDEQAYLDRTKETKEYTLQDDQADRTFVFPPRLEQAMISKYGDYDVYLLFESAAYSYRAQASSVIDRVIVWG